MAKNLSNLGDNEVISRYREMETQRGHHLAQPVGFYPRTVHSVPKSIAKYRRNLLSEIKDRGLEIPEQATIIPESYQQPDYNFDVEGRYGESITGDIFPRAIEEARKQNKNILLSDELGVPVEVSPTDTVESLLEKQQKSLSQYFADKNFTIENIQSVNRKKEEKFEKRQHERRILDSLKNIDFSQQTQEVLEFLIDAAPFLDDGINRVEWKIKLPLYKLGYGKDIKMGDSPSFEEHWKKLIGWLLNAHPHLFQKFAQEFIDNGGFEDIEAFNSYILEK